MDHIPCVLLWPGYRLLQTMTVTALVLPMACYGIITLPETTMAILATMAGLPYLRAFSSQLSSSSLSFRFLYFRLPIEWVLHHSCHIPAPKLTKLSHI